jgi:LL-diaminopimelate aminotransferase
MKKASIQPASRLSLVNEYYFSAKLAEIARMRSQGIDVINLGIGSPDLPPSDNVIEALKRNASDSHNHGYQSYNGIPQLRQAFARWYNEHFDVTLDPEGEILPLIGSKEGIMHVSMAFINPGDEVLVPDPGYPAYAAAASLAGGVPRKYSLTAGNGWYPDIYALESEGVEKVRIMWVNYPHMPTGATATEKLFRDLVAFARRHSILLCNDNPYSFILNDDRLSLLSIPGAMEVALELNSLSKSHNMAGWRIGMVAGDRTFLSNIIKVKSNMDSGMFQPLQAAAAEALASPAEWYSELNTVYRRRRLAAADLMAALSCSYEKEQTGLFLWGKIPGHYADAVVMTDELLGKYHLFITPGTVFGSNGKDYIRISLCATEETLGKALSRITSKSIDQTKINH